MLTGNREFNEIYEKYKNLVLKVAYEYSGDDYDAAQDITQETFLKLYRDFDRLKNGNVYGWLKVTARNTAINYRKKNSREVLELDKEESGITEPVTRSIEEEFEEAEMKLEKSRLHWKIMKGLQKKNPRWYEAMILVYYMNVPQKDAADMLGIKTGALQVMLTRAKNWIRKTYGAEYKEMD